MKADDRADDPGLLDADAVTRAVNGDVGAFDELVRRYQRRAVAVAYRLVGNAHDSCDVAQDAFVRAYRSLSSLQDRQRFGPWLMRIVSNLSLNFRRSRKAGSAASLDLSMEGSAGFRRAGGEGALSSPAPDEGADVDDLSASIRQAMGRLPEKQRLALTLFSVEGMSQKEVAEIMECSVELVKWNVFQARKSLKKMLAVFME